MQECIVFATLKYEKVSTIFSRFCIKKMLLATDQGYFIIDDIVALNDFFLIYFTYYLVY